MNPEADIQGAGWHAHHARIAVETAGSSVRATGKVPQNQYLFLPDQRPTSVSLFAEDSDSSGVWCCSASTLSSCFGPSASLRSHVTDSVR